MNAITELTAERELHENTAMPPTAEDIAAERVGEGLPAQPQPREAHIYLHADSWCFIANSWERTDEGWNCTGCWSYERGKANEPTRYVLIERAGYVEFVF